MEIKELREKASMSRKEFCEYFSIPYRSVQDWELGRRTCNKYVIDLMEYKLRTENKITD